MIAKPPDLEELPHLAGASRLNLEDVEIRAAEGNIRRLPSSRQVANTPKADLWVRQESKPVIRCPDSLAAGDQDSGRLPHRRCGVPEVLGKIRCGNDVEARLRKWKRLGIRADHLRSYSRLQEADLAENQPAKSDVQSGQFFVGIVRGDQQPAGRAPNIQQG